MLTLYINILKLNDMCDTVLLLKLFGLRSTFNTRTVSNISYNFNTLF